MGDDNINLEVGGEPDVLPLQRQGEEEPAGPFPRAVGVDGGPHTEAEGEDGEEDADESKAEKGARAVAAALGSESELGATAGPNGLSVPVARDKKGGAARPKSEDAERAALGAGGSEDIKREAESVAGVAADPHGNGVGVGAAALLAFGATLVAFGAAAAQHHFAVGEQHGVPTPAECTLESMSPFLWAHHGRSGTDASFPAQLPRHPLPGVQPPEATHQEPPHLGRGPWVQMPRSGTSTGIPSTVIGDRPDERDRQDGLYSFLASVLVILLAAAAAALVLLQ